jgi:hypothetical protein
VVADVVVVVAIPPVTPPPPPPLTVVALVTPPGSTVVVVPDIALPDSATNTSTSQRVSGLFLALALTIVTCLARAVQVMSSLIPARGDVI